jgi:hypothetical protein
MAPPRLPGVALLAFRFIARFAIGFPITYTT